MFNSYDEILLLIFFFCSRLFVTMHYHKSHIHQESIKYYEYIRQNSQKAA